MEMPWVREDRTQTAPRKAVLLTLWFTTIHGGLTMYRSEYDDLPIIIQLCMECRHKDCVESCEELRTAYRLLDEGKSPTVEEIKAEATLRMANGAVWPGRNALYTINGTTKRLREWCVSYGISMNTVWDRVVRGTMSIEEALTAPDQRRYTPRKYVYEIEGKRVSLMDISKQTGIRYATLWERVRKGKPLDVAIAMGPAPERKRKHGKGDNPLGNN